MSQTDMLSAAPLSQAPGLMPKTEAELAEILANAAGPLRITGGGTRDIGAPVQGEPLSLVQLSGIVRYDPGALTVVAQAGTPVAEIEALLAQSGQRLPFEPMDHRALLGRTGTPTIGGVVAVNASGPRRIQAGACRDSLIGVRFVDGQGQIIKNGGRVMKNVTGYDLVKLMAGSYGSLGVLSEVSFKTLPAPETQITLQLSGLEDARAVQALCDALSTPYEVTAAAHDPQAAGGANTFLRLEGLAASVAYRSDRLAASLAGYGAVDVVEAAASQTLWQEIRDVTPLAKTPGDIWRISTRPSQAAALMARLGDIPRLYDWGGGLIWLAQPEGRDLRAELGGFSGHATLIRANAETRARLPVFHPQAAPLAALAQNLRASFDPRGILNPGVMS
ncbi:MAG: glycolate oxidase subunit GlcE [Mangrovicoccus sp.]|nr:glycolate oxidase subunit GlcE [Mangrovicoccus sp.]